MPHISKPEIKGELVTLISGRFTAWARTHGNYWIQGWENSRATAHAVAKKSNPASLKG
jgi:hypothetical protein